ncbi:MAG: DUF4124 domain-containing protein [Rhodanobacter sp.]|nr:MAG: DUF4124 domain-containing protein [Rhodanobacter sp.]
MHRSLIVMALLVLAPLVMAQSDNEAYKWTDAQGTVHYQQSPPPPGTHFVKVKIASGNRPMADATAPPPMANARNTPATPSAGVSDTPANNAKLCASLKANLAALKSSGPVVMQQGGKSVALDATQRKQQTAVTQVRYQQFCQRR